MPRILIVDDEPEMVRGLEDNLRFEGYQTLSAADGKQGLARALTEAPDLILLDIMMPGMSGWDVCRELRGKGLDIPAAETHRIFEKFYRIGRSETQGRRGSGVGLALVKHIVEAHGGRVSVESRVGEGSRFTLHLPLSS